MIKLENTEVLGWEATIRGMRNPMNSWEKSDTWFFDETSEGAVYFHELVPKDEYYDHCSDDQEDREEYAKRKQESNSRCVDLIGPNDHKLMMNLAKAGSVDAKYRRMIVVYVDITAPLYWWKEFDTYKVGTVANSCSTMHKIAAKKFTDDDFSFEHLMNWDEYEDDIPNGGVCGDFKVASHVIIDCLNEARDLYLQTKDKRFWWQMIQLLPSSYNQRRTVMLNYEVLANMYASRKEHKLDEWRDFCKWIEGLPYSEIITLKGE